MKGKVEQLQINPQEYIYDYLGKISQKSRDQIQVRLQKNGENINRNSQFLEYYEPRIPIAFYIFEISEPFDQSVPQYKTQSSIGQYGFQQQQDVDSSINIEQQNNSLKVLEQIDRYQNLSTESIQSIEKIPSIKKFLTTQCKFCQQYINGEEEEIQLPCQHFYHMKCFSFIAQDQFTKKEPVLRCICNNKLKIQILSLLDDKYSAEALKYGFILNQLQIIEQNLKYSEQFRKCINRKVCNFFYLHQTSLKEEHKICPYCLIEN